MASAKLLSNPNSQNYDAALINTERVRDFIAHTAFEATNVQRINLGTTNFTFRLFLARPYGPKKCTTAILKYAAAYLASEPNVPFNPTRQLYESRAMQWIPGRVFSGVEGTGLPTIRIPQLYLEDIEHAVCIMEDVASSPCSSPPMLEETTHSARAFFEGNMNVEWKYDVASQLGDTLGLFLGQLHRWGSKVDPLLANDLFKDNDSAREVTIQTTFRDLIPRLEKSRYSLNDNQREEVLELMQQMENRVSSHLETLIMGDFWLGNLVLNFDPDGKQLISVNVIDWEFATMAPAFTDLGHFVGEVFLNNYFEAIDDVYTVLLESFLRAYEKSETSIDTPNVLSYAGAHIGCFASQRVESPRSKATYETCITCIGQAMDLMNISGNRESNSTTITFERLISLMRQRQKIDFA